MLSQVYFCWSCTELQTNQNFPKPLIAGRFKKPRGLGQIRVRGPQDMKGENNLYHFEPGSLIVKTLTLLQRSQCLGRFFRAVLPRRQAAKEDPATRCAFRRNIASMMKV